MTRARKDEMIRAEELLGLREMAKSLVLEMRVERIG
jgi:hypothetical protein